MDSSPRSKKNFNNLPYDTLMEIFKNLNFNDLKNASLVNKSWNNTISTSNKFLKKTRLRLRYDKSFKYIKTTRDYRDVIIECTDYFLAYLLNTSGIDQFCSKIQNLQFKITLTEPREIKQINGKCSIMIELPKLKKLVVTNCTYILNNIICNEIDYLEIRQSPHSIDNVEKSSENLITFLNKLQRLDELSLISYKFKKSSIDFAPKFQLKSLKLFDVKVAPSFTNIIETCKNLEKISISYLSEIDFIIQLLNESQNINELQISFTPYSCHEFEENLGNLRILNEVKTVKVLKDNWSVKILAEKLPNVDTFDFDFDTIDHLVVWPMQTHVEKIKTLRIETFSKISHFHNFVFPNLENLEIKYFHLHDMSLMKIFGNAHENLKIVKVDMGVKIQNVKTIKRVVKIMHQRIRETMIHTKSIHINDGKKIHKF